MIMDWALTTGYSVALLIVFVLLIRKPVARHLGAKSAYALWLLPLIRLFIPSIILPAKPATPTFPMTPIPSGTVSSGDWPSAMTGGVSTIQHFTDFSVLVWVWLSGACLILLWQIQRHIRFRRILLTRSQLASGSILATASTLIGDLGLKCLPEIRISSDPSGPMVTGLFSPVIVLPTYFEADYSEAQQKYALAHELAHISRRDIWAASAVIIFKAVNWPNPLMHWAQKAFREDQEAACDATVISVLGPSPQTKTAYAETLIHAAKLVRSARLAGFSERPIPVGLTIHNPLKERLMIMNIKPGNRLSLRVAVSTLALAAILGTASYDRAEAQQSPTPPTPPHTTAGDHSIDKKVMKWVTNENGAEVSKHIEITTENGVTTAYEIDELGNKILIDADEIVMPHGGHLSGMDSGQMRIMFKKLGENGDIDFDFDELTSSDPKDIKIIMEKLGQDKNFDMEVFEKMHGKNVFVFEGESEMDVINDGHSKMIIKSLTGDEFSTTSKPEMMVSIAGSMLDDIDTGTLDRKARKKIEAARKALAEAQEILEDE